MKDIQLSRILIMIDTAMTLTILYLSIGIDYYIL